ncbi:hypothetical protein [Flavobacterium psychrotrophum]|uniref:hypothetical protein n=1 Tax=Flavobacterium psychrotrophum TaxID=2294119 RepID=UPI000E30E6F9|nr:hypothetical protein [Flavobacterium psychrotrophum]
MKKFFIKLLFAATFAVPAVSLAQTDCTYVIEDTTAGQELSTTNDYLMYEKVFGGNSQFLFFSLSNSQGLPVLNFQLLGKGNDFLKVSCFEKASKIYIQLINGKIITLLSASEDQCSNLLYDDNQKTNISVLTGTFLFTKGSFEELEKSPISFIRVKYATETVDYPVGRLLKSETMGKPYNPENYFINYLKCVK